jgi:putative flavoprotein involved in K+ transport
MATKVDVLVVGAGQAGLATARAVSDLAMSFVVHERHARIGESWRQRFDSLVLFTPRFLSELPGLPHTGDPQGYPGKDEMGNYLERYAERLRLPVRTANGIVRLWRGAGTFIAQPERGGNIECKAVVVATGAFQRARIPGFFASLADHVQRLDTLSYRGPVALSASHVIVVGDGATGRQIALELARSRKVVLATGRYRFFGPQRVLGADATSVALHAGWLTADKTTLVARLIRSFDPTPGLHLRSSALRRAGVMLAPRCVGAQGDHVSFADGSHRYCEAVVCATGYRDDTAWIDIESAATSEAFLEDHGIAPVQGLYYVGRDWQTSRASGLLCGVYRDAQLIATRVREYIEGSGPRFARRA